MKCKITIPLVIVGNILFSCEPDHIAQTPQYRTDVNPLLAKEIVYNAETSEKIQEIIYSYNNYGLVERQSSTGSGDFDNWELQFKYEYDGDNNLIKRNTHTKDINHFGTVNITDSGVEYTYENGLMKSETGTYNGKPSGYRTIYFYTGERLDSSRCYYSYMDENLYQYLHTTFYTYDGQSHLVKTSDEKGRTIKRLRYEGDRLMEISELFNPFDGSAPESHTVNEYNNVGQLISATESSARGFESRVLYSYKDGRLDGKKVYSYLYSDPGKKIEVELIRYEYH
ncbi:MAG: hypothetical protein QM762_23870 [Chryseolinea sp.]